uniref:Uncharacterized protein n=1 Tax=Acrobeloides nanus TaxID=290746 RepID=A0A914EJL4_9BILA
MHETEQYVETCYGSVLVSIYGDRKKLPIVTFHDIGLNAQDNFGHFFKHDTGNIFNQAFCIYNINAPGQELNAKPFASE